MFWGMIPYVLLQKYRSNFLRDAVLNMNEVKREASQLTSHDLSRIWEDISYSVFYPECPFQ